MVDVEGGFDEQIRIRLKKLPHKLVLLAGRKIHLDLGILELLVISALS